MFVDDEFEDLDFEDFDIEDTDLLYRDYDMDEEFLRETDFNLAFLEHKIKKFEAQDLKLVPKKVHDVAVVFNIIKKIIKPKANTDVSYLLNEPYLTTGSVSITSRNIIITNPQIFAKLLRIADNFEAYPLTNGNVQMNFGFNGLVEPTKYQKGDNDD